MSLKKRGVCNATVKKFHSLLKVICDQGNPESPDLNPVRRIKDFEKLFSREASTRDINFLTPEEIVEILNTAKNYNDLEPTEKSAPVNAFYYYGQALHFNYKFDEALANYEKFKSFLKNKNVDLIKDVDRQIEISNNAKLLVTAPMNIILKKFR